MRTNTPWILSAALSLAMVTGHMHAQSTSTLREETWPNSRLLLSQGSKVELVTLATPKKKQKCLIASLDSDTIACAKHGGKIMTYSRTDIAAIIRPGTSSHVGLIALGLLASSGASIWAAVILAAACPGCAVGLSVLGTLFVAAAGACGIADYGDAPESLIYLKPNETLQVKLR